ncbi:Ribosomal RNA large subunit methyltransferase E [Desulfamplus magnetovallimortis]|uniref:Ribosomal RNA large subunit methyltransferase E n=1 Tax=Desulfamplus magnetovallimortis TaxID=1246637 RepID=A0A1W1HGG9_9BACT|nr:RlmE family RNA methyltransferase [Desulfamplus magnetovallimortis]SLM31482.1 Ribosomal RNA large subunit methyltransferase E [Desulfamplus magnetovallimortis]
MKRNRKTGKTQDKKNQSSGNKKSANKVNRVVKGRQQWADHLTEKAKQENYPARSVYKLMEIQKKFTIIQKGSRVLDFGCAPGSWLLYAAKTAGENGRVNGIDLKSVEIELPSNATAFVGDIFDMNEELAAVVGKGYDVILSDMAPATTGRKDVDEARSIALCQAALKAASDLLETGGNFVCKIFQGGDFKHFENDFKAIFSSHSIFRPESCRKSSKEIYIIGKGRK